MIPRSGFLLGVPLVAATTLRARAQPAPVLRVGAVPSEGFMEAWYANDMGFFSDVGLTVEVLPFHNGGDISTAIVGGAIDVGISSVITLANALLHGIQFVYFAAGNLYLSSAPTIALCVPKDSPVRAARDFEGRTISGVTLKDPLHLATVTWLTKNGVDISKVDIVETPASGMLAVLTHGTVAAAIMPEPYLSAAVAGGARIFATCFDAIAPRIMLGGWFSTAKWVQDNPALARRFATVIYRTAKWANAQPAQSTSILEKYTKLDDAAVRHMTRATFADSLNPALIDPILKRAAEYRFIERPVSAREMIAVIA